MRSQGQIDELCARQRAVYLGLRDEAGTPEEKVAYDAMAAVIPVYQRWVLEQSTASVASVESVVSAVAMICGAMINDLVRNYAEEGRSGPAARSLIEQIEDIVGASECVEIGTIGAVS
jgi:hypothetical protein